MIDFTLSTEQQEIRKGGAQFATKVLSRAPCLYANLKTQNERFVSTRPLYREAVKAGLIKGQVPKALGGSGGHMIEAAILSEQVYAADPSTALTILGTGLGILPLVFGGTPELHKRFLAPFLSGEGDPLASLVHSEPQGTANWLEKGGAGLSTTARKEGDTWVINGEKLWTTNSGGWDGKGADLQCVVCREAPDGGPQDPSADPRKAILILIVTREVIADNPPEAYEILSDPELAGHVATSGPHSKFTNLRVPASHLLAPPGKGAEVIAQAFGGSAGIVGAMSVSIMHAAFNAALAFAKSDARGGSVPIIERQSVADLLIDIKMKMDASRLLTWKAFDALENGPGSPAARLELELEAKIFCSENAVQSCVDAMKVVGMTSYAKDQPFSHLLNDAMCLPLFDGGNIGVRRRQLEKIMKMHDYDPCAAFY